MAQVVSCLPLTAETRASPCGICSGRSGTGRGISSVSPVSINPPWLSILISSGDEQKARWWPQFRDVIALST
jgi:hypothetical protein